MQIARDRLFGEKQTPSHWLPNGKVVLIFVAKYPREVPVLPCSVEPAAKPSLLVDASCTLSGDAIRLFRCM